MIDPIGAASFPCGEIPKHRKKAPKNTPKKADHKHEYESVLLSYISKNAYFNPAVGFLPARSWYAGKRCIHCGRLDLGFPDGTCPAVAHHVNVKDGKKHFVIINPDYAHLPEVRVNDLFDLKEENTYG